MSSDDPVALVTGSRKGIGRYLAEHLLRRGYRVIGCSRNPAEWKAESYRHIQADVTNEDQIKLLVRDISASYGRLDAAINNAGTASMNHALLTPASTFRNLLDSNMLGTFLVCREAAKLMRRRRFGRIVNFSSVAVPLRLEGQAAYVASKCAVVGFSQTLAREVADFGITVNVVSPGPVDTDMIRGVPKEKIDRLLRSLPVKRLTSFTDIANVVDFFLCAKSEAITGQVVNLNGTPNV